MDISKLLQQVPPRRDAPNKGARALWKRVRSLVDLPSWIYDLYHAYGSGFFTVFDNHGLVIDYVHFRSVFEKPILGWHRRIGSGFSDYNRVEPSVQFFPNTKDGLFPVMSDSDGRYLLLDPLNDDRVYYTSNFLVGFSRVDCTLVDFLCDTFSGKRDYGFLGPPEPIDSIATRAAFYLNWKDGYLEAQKAVDGSEALKRPRTGRRKESG